MCLYWFGELRADVISAMLTNKHTPYHFRERFRAEHSLGEANEKSAAIITDDEMIHNQKVWKLLEPIITRFARNSSDQ